ncbi:MAG: hypothetical protein K2F83_00630, partial [Oscillospiraceae bacterium]|nr:hypothetical protein [Oscillospiraceae bacterium]
LLGGAEDLKMLQHYRCVRNQIAHEPGCTEENMCERGDAVWLDSFHARIMSRTDPLALYVRATRPQPAQRPKQTYTPQLVRRTPQPAERMFQSARYAYPRQTVGPQKKRKPAGCLTFLIAVLLLGATAILILQILQIDFGTVLKYLNLV